jgi:UDP-glucose 4-epimerase
MRVAVIGATGNVGTSLLEALAGEPEVDEIVGIARRVPRESWPKVRWWAADIRSDDLTEPLRGCSAVVHLAWAIQPSHRLPELAATNLGGTVRVLEALIEVGVPSLVYASSVGAYAPGPKHRRVDESWPVTGIRSSFYSRHKARVEAILDTFSAEHPGVRIVRMRPGLIFKRGAGAEVAGLFLGPLFGRLLAHRSLIKVVPQHPRLRVQAEHSHDVAQAYRRAIVSDVSGPFNLAAEPVIDAKVLARTFHAVAVPVPAPVMKVTTSALWHTRLQPTPPGWVDLGLQVPLMAYDRAEAELGWAPRVDAASALHEVVEGIADKTSERTPAMAGEPVR